MYLIQDKLKIDDLLKTEFIQIEHDLLVGRAVTLSFLEREVGSLKLGPVKSLTDLPTARDRGDISLKMLCSQQSQ